MLAFVSKDVSGDARVLREALTAQEMGMEVRLVVWDRAGGLPRHERLQGLLVERVSTPLARLLPGMTARNPVWWRKAYRHTRDDRPDLIVCHDLDTLAIGAALKRRHGAPLLYDAHEVFYHMIVGDVPRIVSAAAKRLERRLLRRVDHLLVADPSYLPYYRDVAGYGGPATALLNCTRPAPTGDFPPLPDRSQGLRLFYPGTLTPDRLVTELARLPLSMPQVSVTIAGSGPEARRITNLARQDARIHFIGSVPYDAILDHMRASHAVPAMTDPANENLRLATSVKQYEAMAAGRPVIAARGSATGDLVEATQTGVTVPFSARGLREGVQILLDDPAMHERLAQNAYKAAQETYNWEHQSERLQQVYRDLLAKRGPAAPTART